MKKTELELREISKYLDIFNFDKFLNNKTLLLTGAKGLVGTGIVKWILMMNELRETNTRIIASTRNPAEMPTYIEDIDNIICCEYGKEDLIEEKIDYIIHAASPTGNKYHMRHPVETFKTNVDGVEKMLEIAEKNSGCSMIYLSSEEVYGLPSDDSPVMIENMVGAIDSLNLRSCYPLGKKASEFLCYASAKEYDIDVKIIRPTVIHGLFQKYEETRVVNELLQCLLEDKDFVMKSDGMTKKCMMYSLDAISAIFTVLFLGRKGEVYNASNPDTFITIRDLAQHLIEVFNPNIKVVFENGSAAEADGFLPHRTIVQDCTKLMNLGWKPYGSLEHIYEVDIERFKAKVLHNKF